MDDKLFDYVRQISLIHLTSSSSYSFNQFSVKTITKNNNGIISALCNCCIYVNKCFFIAFSDGLAVNGIFVSPYDLAQACNMLNNEMVDTNNQYHVYFLQELINYYQVRLEIFIGQYDSNSESWVTTPYPTSVIGNGSNIIRILNMCAHFDYLVDIENGFLSDVNDSNIQSIVFEQFSVLKIVETEKTDARIIENLVHENPLLIAEQKLWDEQKQVLRNLDQENIDADIAQKIYKDEMFLIQLLEKDKEYAEFIALQKDP